MNAPKLNALVRRKTELEEELNRLVHRRSALKTKAARLKLIPEAVRITGAISDIEREIQKQKQPQRA